MNNEVFNKNIYDTLMDIGSFRAFCDLKRNHSRLLFSNIISSLDNASVHKFNIPKMRVSSSDSLEDSLEEETDYSELREDELDRLYNLYDVNYKFNRGFVMTDGLGKKVEDIFDGTDKRLISEIINLARDEFNVEVPFLGYARDFQEIIDATNKGLSVTLFDGNIAQIYLPNTVTNEMLDEIISEVEVRDDFIFFIVRDNEATDELLKDEVLDYLNSLYELENDDEEEVVEEEIDNNKISNYIRDLILYTLDNKISVYDYYRMLGENYRNSMIDKITEFEKHNPFLNADDILKLIESDDENIVDSFAESMNRVIMHNFNGEDYEDEFLNNFNDNLNEDENIGQVTSINLDLLYSADGFVLINEKKVGTLSVYGYEANNPDEVKGKTTYENVPGYIESGFYINFMEFEENLRAQYNNKELSFITAEGEELEYDIVMDAALELSRQNGAIRLGKEFKEKEINSVSDLKELYTGEQANYKGTILNKGMFVSRDILYDFFSRLQVKVKGHDISQNIESINDQDTSFEYVK